MINQIQLPTGFLFRPAQSDDSQFLLTLFRSTREHLLLLPLPKLQLELLISQQFLLQQNHYATHYPQSSNFIIQFNSIAVGKITLDESSRSLRIIDLAINLAERNKGYGKSIVQALQSYVLYKKVTLVLSVDQQNTRAKKMYLELGFSINGVSETHEQMIWNGRDKITE